MHESSDVCLSQRIHQLSEGHISNGGEAVAPRIAHRGIACCPCAAATSAVAKPAHPFCGWCKHTPLQMRLRQESDPRSTPVACVQLLRAAERHW
eukprot:395026-Amphidinium_carterae.2